MADTLGSGNMSLREKLATLLQGDAKNGSIRQHLVQGMMGGTGGQDTGMVDYTPFGAVFAKGEGDRAMKSGDYGKAAAAMAGLIPGAGGRGVEAAAALIKSAGHTMTPEILKQVGAALADHAPGEVSSFLRGQGLNPNSIKEALAAHAAQNGPQGTKLNKYVDHPGRALQIDEHIDDIKGEAAARGGANPTLRQSLEQNIGVKTSADEDLGKVPRQYGPKSSPDQSSKDIMAAYLGSGDFRETKLTPGEMGEDAARHDAQSSIDINTLADGDPHKANFIKNAMQDEGGNVPEDVAMTLIDHLQKKDPHRLKQLLDDHEIISSRAPQGTEINENSMADLAQSLTGTHSVPEMLAMHYDLDPETFKHVYDMPQGQTQVTRKPTQ